MCRSIPFALLSLIVGCVLSFFEASPRSRHTSSSSRSPSSTIASAIASTTPSNAFLSVAKVVQGLSLTFSASTSSASTAMATAASTSRKSSPGKPVFMHYMVNGILEDHCRQDILDAQALGFDAFALNLPMDLSMWWVANTVTYLFKHAELLGFKVFFSFDFAPGYFTDPSQFVPILQKYMSSSAHYKYNGLPLVSTFSGSSISTSAWNSMRSTLGTPIVLVPGFYDVTPSPLFFSTHPSFDGIFNWNSWPWREFGKIPVSTVDDQTYMSAAHASSKLFVMGMSPLQFKHMDASPNNWYARGEQNLEYRMDQVLQMQPDMLEMQTWNDAGEGHYMGNIWDETQVNLPIKAYSEGYDHRGYWEVLPAFIQAWKRGDTNTTGMRPTNGKAVQGVFWHHTLTANADCSPDPIGKGLGFENVEDVVTGIVLVADGQSGLTVVAKLNGQQIGYQQLTTGFNRFVFSGVQPGSISVEIWGPVNNMLVSGSGPLQIVSSSDTYNYNFQVVALR